MEITEKKKSQLLLRVDWANDEWENGPRHACWGKMGQLLPSVSGPWGALHTLGTLPVGPSAHRLLRQRRRGTNLREPVHPPTEQLQPDKAAGTTYLTEHWTRLQGLFQDAFCIYEHWSSISIYTLSCRTLILFYFVFCDLESIVQK